MESAHSLFDVFWFVTERKMEGRKKTEDSAVHGICDAARNSQLKSVNDLRLLTWNSKR
jgi:hypothetical protein